MDQNERIATGQILEGRYEVQELLGQGGFAAVYRAWDVHLHRSCAIKENRLATPESQRQFEREAKLLAGLHHPNLPRVTDHFVLPGRGQYLVMDYVAGEDLHQQVFGQNSFLNEAQALEWILPICEALTYLHNQVPPVIHRDVKPQNIILTSSGQPFLVDFGIAKTYKADLATTTGARAVSPGYSPPEQYGQAATDARSDLYSLAATLYTLLTRSIPPDSVDVMSGSQAAPPLAYLLNPGVSRQVSEAIQCAMNPARAGRFVSVAAFKQALLQPPNATVTGETTATIAVMSPRPAGAPKVGAPKVGAPKGSQKAASRDRPVRPPEKAARSAEKVAKRRLSPVPSPGLAPAGRSPIPVPGGTRPTAKAIQIPGFNWALPVVGIVGFLGLVGVLAVVWLIIQANSPARPLGLATPENGHAAAGAGIERTPTAPLPTREAAAVLALASETPRFTPSAVPSPTPIPPGIDDVAMVDIPAGKFSMGMSEEVANWHLSLCNEFSTCDHVDYQDAMPAHSVYLDAFKIDAHEVTNLQYQACVQAGACQPAPQSIFSEPLPGDYATEPSYARYPAVGMYWDDAVAYCKWVGKSLPSEAQWERAATGEGKWVFPWGNPDPQDPLNITLIFGTRAPLANYCDQTCTFAWRDPQNNDGWVGPAPVSTYPANFMGLYDLAGNVQEWVLDFYSPDFYSRSPQGNPVNNVPSACPGRSELDCHLARGGGWNNGLYHTTARFRYYAYAGNAKSYRGFRCVSTP